MRPFHTFLALAAIAVIACLHTSCSSTDTGKIDQSKVVEKAVQLAELAATSGYLEGADAEIVTQALHAIQAGQADTEQGRDLIATARAIVAAAAQSGKLPPQHALLLQAALILTA